MNRQSRFYKLIGIVFILLLFSDVILVRAAEKESKLVGRLVGHKVVLDPQGRETLIPITEVFPKDIVEYTLVYRNQDKVNALTNIVIASPIPPETVWVIHSEKAEKPSRFEASIDGGKKYQVPPVLIKTVGPAGKEMEVEAPAERYTHLRWILSEPLLAGEEVSATYRVYVK